MSHTVCKRLRFNKVSHKSITIYIQFDFCLIFFRYLFVHVMLLRETNETYFMICERQDYTMNIKIRIFQAFYWVFIFITDFNQ